VAQTAARLKEAAKLGFARAFAPETARADPETGIEVIGIRALLSLVGDVTTRRQRVTGPRPVRQDG
jgi:DNA repair protein RadA/Sms